ncbi:hypothetical protein EHS13_04780 [Paenibacillus psychroresistens]|uniref:Xylose isomerase-like TIM barrel domain-containing protein n=1 Tax=Paenibacillus psychroresistens TaxID=1778678 RepID=A0A6B8RFX6_9BACL|nr:TIM barrel protein [Paenibacillus psychroresistens]QGQ94266.1 hypothetical protein EHS13_04780 [Paenibacillus psychroresistens]
MTKTDPKLYLALDNCFAKKRWTSPNEWVKLIHDLGVYYVEASSDNEFDPLYGDPAYLADWLSEMKEACTKWGVHVANFYSGHGSYTTLGLAHTDIRIRDRMLNDWLKPMALLSAQAGAGLGFYCHAYSNAVLQNGQAYMETEQDLYRRLAELAVYCKACGVRTPGVEQMYSPNQIPWTIDGAEKLLREVYRMSSSSPFYLTLDTGHQSGQRRYMRPSASIIREAAGRVRQGERLRDFWLGPETASNLFAELVKSPIEQEVDILTQMDDEMNKFPQLFADYKDGDTYLWLEKLARYSPIIHLQQTNGTSSAHQPFTEEYNSSGVIFGDQVLQAISKSYQDSSVEGMPPVCDEIYLTLEIFAGTSEMNSDIKHKILESVKYWRKYIPQDGIRLSEALRLITLA